MERAEIQEKLQDWFAGRHGSKTLDGTTLLFDRGILDSMNVLELAMHVERVFGIRVGPLDMVEGNFRTLDDLAAYIAKKGHI